MTLESKPPCFLQIQPCGSLLQKFFQQGVYDSSFYPLVQAMNAFVGLRMQQQIGGLSSL
jgi:hypothetical protein